METMTAIVEMEEEMVRVVKLEHGVGVVVIPFWVTRILLAR